MEKSYHHGDVPGALMQAALLRIKEDGVEKLSLRAIARDIGVSQTAPYRHFKDKNHLLVALACAGFKDLAKKEHYLPSCNNLTDGLMNAGLAYIQFAKHSPEQYRLMFGNKIENRCQQPELEASAQAAFEVIVSFTTRGVASGDFIHKDPLVLARGCWAFVHGLASLTIDGFYDDLTTELDEFLKEQFSLFQRSISANPNSIDMEQGIQSSTT